MDLDHKTKLAIGLRVYEKNREALVKKMRFLEKVPWNLVEKVFVAVNIEKDQSGALEYFRVILNDPRVEAFPVQPWFKTGVPALNAIVHKATAEKFTHLWLVSTRLIVNENIVTRLLEECDVNTLVVGAIMSGHWIPGAKIVAGDGETCPYNTCAIWNLSFLHRTGFLPLSEMPTNLEMAGNEEVAVVTLQQQLFKNRAKLVSISGIESQTSHWDDERKERHQNLVNTKKVRSEAQLDMLPLDQAKITHIC